MGAGQDGWVGLSAECIHLGSTPPTPPPQKKHLASLQAHFLKKSCSFRFFERIRQDVWVGKAHSPPPKKIRNKFLVPPTQKVQWPKKKREKRKRDFGNDRNIFRLNWGKKTAGNAQVFFIREQLW